MLALHDSQLTYRTEGNCTEYVELLDIDNKLHNCLQITGILKNVFRRQKTP